MLTCITCGQIIETRACSFCSRQNLTDAVYCSYCGKNIHGKIAQKKKGSKPSSDPYDIENRILCSDGACIGIINENGVCTDCGRAFEG